MKQLEKTKFFCEEHGLAVPILMASMVEADALVVQGSEAGGHRGSF